jgi:site-specific recombinase XerD
VIEIDLPLLDEFLKTYSSKNQKMNRDRLNEFRDFVVKLGITDISHIKKTHIETYLMDCLEKKDLAITTKDHYYATIRVYFKYLYENEIITQIPPFSTRVIFTEQIDMQRLEKENMPLPDENDILQLLKMAQNENTRMYIYLMIAVHNGGRDSEIRSIMLKNIKHLQSKIREHGVTKEFDFWIIVSGQIEGHRKQGTCYYFIPPGLCDTYDWQLYQDELKKQFKDPIYLFQTEPNHFLSYRSVWENLDMYARKLNLKCRVNPHIFRDVVNEFRMDEGCSEPILSILLNQKNRGTNATYYTKKCKNPGYRYKYWIKFTPQFFPDKLPTIKESNREEIVLTIESELKIFLIEQAKRAGLTLKNFIIEKLSE